MIAAVVLSAILNSGSFVVWQPPVDGSPVSHYVFQVLDEAGDVLWSVNTAATATVAPSHLMDPRLNYVGRVSAVDPQGHQGPWSRPFLWYNRPGAPSTPEMVLAP